MNIIEKRRRKAWAHATMVIMNKVIREASTGTIFIYGETLYGKDYFLTPDDALDAVLVTMGVLRKLWERDGVRPSKRLFAEVCPDRAIGAVVMKMWREPFRYWNLMKEECAAPTRWSIDRATGAVWPSAMTARPPSRSPMPCRTSCAPAL